MSEIVIAGNTSGSVTIAAPDVAGTTTLTLPATSGTLNTSGAVNVVPAGSAATPAITTTGDTNTGIFFPAADTIAFAEGGVESMRIDSSGNVAFNKGIREKVFAVSGTTPALSPANGTIQTWTLSGSSTPTAGTWNAGESITLMIDDGSAYTVTWPSVTWVNNDGTAPTLATTGYTVVALWKVSTTLYGALVGNGG